MFLQNPVTCESGGTGYWRFLLITFPDFGKLQTEAVTAIVYLFSDLLLIGVFVGPYFIKAPVSRRCSCLFIRHHSTCGSCLLDAEYNR